MGGIKIIYGWKAVSLRLTKFDITSFECEEYDVEEKLVNPKIFNDASPTLGALLRAGVNLALNSKLV